MALMVEMFEMKIIDLCVERYRVQRRPHRWRSGLRVSPGGEGIEQLLRVRTDAGIDGLCWIGAEPTHAQLIERILKPACAGVDVWMREQLWQEIWEIDRLEVLPVAALGWVDVALWDIQAKVAKIPCYQLMGGHKSKVRAYASTITLDSTDDYLRLIDDCLQRGYRAVKLHVWGETIRDMALARAVRRHVGGDVDLMLDGSGGYSYDDSVRLGEVLQEEGYLWFEEPMREHSLLAYERLCARLDIAVLGAEMSPGAHFNAAEWVGRAACDRLRTSWWCKGGLTGALKVAHLAEARQMAADVHGDDLASLHLSCALANSQFVELLVPEDVFGNATVHGRLHPDDGGFVAVPATPGFGWEPDLAARVA